MEVAELLEEYLTPRSPAAVRFYGLGFTIGAGKPSVLNVDCALPRLHVVVPFTCACGKQEYFQATATHPAALVLRSFFDDLEFTGAMSPSHLYGDGYSIDEVLRMERRAARFAEAMKGKPWT